MPSSVTDDHLQAMAVLATARSIHPGPGISCCLLPLVFGGQVLIRVALDLPRTDGPPLAVAARMLAALLHLQLTRDTRTVLASGEELSLETEVQGNSLIVHLHAASPDAAAIVGRLLRALMQCPVRDNDLAAVAGMMLGQESENLFDPMQQSATLLLRLLHPADHPTRPPSADELAAASRHLSADQLSRWRDCCLQGANLRVSVIGDLAADTEDRISTILTDLLSLRSPHTTDDAIQMPAPIDDHAHQDAGRVEAIGIGRAIPETPGTSRFEALRAACHMLGGGPRSRLFRQLRERLKLVYYIKSRLHEPVGGLPGLLQVVAHAPASRAPEVLELIMAELKRTAEHGLEPRTIPWAVDMTVQSQLIDLGIPHGLARELDHSLRHGTPPGQALQTLAGLKTLPAAEFNELITPAFEGRFVSVVPDAAPASFGE